MNLRETEIPDDKALVTAVRAGDRQAFARLVERYFTTVWTIAYSRLGQHAAADDLAQEVFLLALLRLETLSDPNRFAAWLSRIAHNRVAEWLRQKQRASKLMAVVPMDSLDHAMAEAQEPAMDSDEEHRVVREAIFALPEQQREIVLLRFVEGLNNTRIAERLDVHPVTVGRQLEKAMETMRASLESVVEESVRQIRPSRRAVVNSTSLAGVVATMSGSSRAALASAVGQIAMPGTGTTVIKGALVIMATGKMKAAIVAGIILLLSIGIGILAHKSAGPVADSAPSSPTMQVQSKSPALAKFSDGTSIEVLGIQSIPSSDGKWWAADGSDIAAPPHPDQPRISMRGGDGTRTLRFMLRQSNPGKLDQGVVLDLIPGLRMNHSSYGGGGRGRSIEALAIVRPDQTVADLQVGVAGGPWTDDLTYDAASGQSTAAKGSWIHIRDIAEEGRETRVEVDQLPQLLGPRRDTTIIAIADGKELQMAHGRESGMGITYYFACAKSDITSIIARSRSYETITIKNVSLVPAASPTHVQIAPATSPSTR